MLKILSLLFIAVSMGYASELIVVEGGIGRIERLDSRSDIRVVYESTDYFVALAPSGTLTGETESTLLDSGDLILADYLLVHLSSPEGLQYMDELGEVVLNRDNVVIVRLSGPAPENFIRDGVFFLQPLRVMRTGDVSVDPFLLEPADSPDGYIEDIVAAVSEDSIKAHIQYLENYGTRYSSTDNYDTACDWVESKFISYGMTAEQQVFGMSGYDCQNVIAELPGTTDSTKIYIICGHLDSTSGSPYSNAPGADDNASGSSAVIEAARILTGYEFDYTIRFICFGGEEQGLYGSSFYASGASSAGDDIVGVVNLDMVLYGPPSDDILWVPYNTQSTDLALALEAICDTYVPALKVDIEYSPGTTYSDHASFWNNGYAAVLGIEQEVYSNPYYHQTTDLLANYTAYFPFGTDCIRGAVATVAYLAGPKTATGLEEGTSAGNGLTITGAFPNPVSAGFAISFSGADAGSMEVSLYDIAGRVVISGSHDASSGRVDLDLSQLPPGVYTVRASSGNHMDTRNIVIAR
jgi:hypothetical protein